MASLQSGTALSRVKHARSPLFACETRSLFYSTPVSYRTPRQLQSRSAISHEQTQHKFAFSCQTTCLTPCIQLCEETMVMCNFSKPFKNNDIVSEVHFLFLQNLRLRCILLMSRFLFFTWLSFFQELTQPSTFA